MTDSDANVYRPAGRLERFFIERQCLGFDANVVVAAHYTTTDDLRLTKERLYPALAQLLRKHAPLSVHVKNERSSRPLLARLERVNLNDVVTFTNKPAVITNRSLEELLENEFMHPVTNSDVRPLWRLIVTSNNYAVFVWYHVIADGQSGGIVFHRSLLEALNAASATPSDSTSQLEEIVTIPTNLKLTPCVEDLVDLSVSFKTFATELAGLAIPRSWYQRTVWTGNKVVNGTYKTLKCHVRCIPFTPIETKQLLALSRKHGATLTATIYALCVSILSSLITESTSQAGANGAASQRSGRRTRRKYNRLVSSVAASLRPFTDVPDTVMRTCVSTLHSTEKMLPPSDDDASSSGASESPKPLSPPFPWDLAASYSKRLHDSLPKAREVVGCLKFLFGHYKGFFKGKIGKKRELSFEMSNLGAFKVDESQTRPWNIDRTFFAQDDGIAGAAIKISIVGDPQGAIGITVAWREGQLEDDFAESFSTDLRLRLGDLAHTSES